MCFSDMDEEVNPWDFYDCYECESCGKLFSATFEKKFCSRQCALECISGNKDEILFA